MKENPLVSVVIPTYNMAHFVVDAVQSALRQTYSPMEVIVADDGSTDNTREVLRPFDSCIKYLHHPNRGLPATRNRAIREASGELIAFLDADDQWHPDKLARQWEVLKANPEVGLVHTGALLLDQETGRTTEPQNSPRDCVGHCLPQIFGFSRVYISSVLLRREVLGPGDAFDETLRSCEDWDLWLRLAPQVAFEFVNQPLLLYRLHGTNMTRNEVVIAKYGLAVLRKAIDNTPTLRKQIGWLTVERRLAKARRRLATAYFSAGYDYYDRGALPEAKQAFGHSLMHFPWKTATWAYWVATLMPAPVVGGLRKMKHRVAGVTNGR